MPMSEEQKKAASERMKAYHAAKKQLESEEPMPVEEVRGDDYEALKRQVDELKAMLLSKNDVQAPQYHVFQQQPQMMGGKIIGTQDKYILDPNYYPDPCQRLSQEPKLQQFAFSTNYELDFKVNVSSYQTKDGLNVREPRFNMELYKVKIDDETGEPTNLRYVIARSVFHEDPDAAVTIARQKGLEVNRDNEKEFLDEMRYLQMRDWLFELFYPPRNTAAKSKKEVVIGNRLVEVFEINSENPTEIPFGELTKKG